MAIYENIDGVITTLAADTTEESKLNFRYDIITFEIPANVPAAYKSNCSITLPSGCSPKLYLVPFQENSDDARDYHGGIGTSTTGRLSYTPTELRDTSLYCNITASGNVVNVAINGPNVADTNPAITCIIRLITFY